MSDSDYHAAADAVLTRLLDVLDDAIGDTADVELDNGVLSIELADGGTYIINKHVPLRQIWVSSPISGAAHFVLEEGGDWVSTRSGTELFDLLAGEIQSKTGVRLDL